METAERKTKMKKVVNKRIRKFVGKSKLRKAMIVVVVMIASFIYANIEIDKKLEKTDGIQLVDCVDGDTAKFMVNGKEEKVRFLAIDTPETKHPNKPEGYYGKEASEYTCTRLQEANEIVFEFEKDTHDKYDRMLAWVWIDGSLLQQELVSQGYAEVKYEKNSYNYIEKLKGLQAHAEEQKLGIWSK